MLHGFLIRNLCQTLFQSISIPLNGPLTDLSHFLDQVIYIIRLECKAILPFYHQASRTCFPGNQHIASSQ